MKTRIILFFVLMIAAASLTNAQVTYVFQEGENSYSGTADTFFMGQDLEAVNGYDDEWEWDGEDGGFINYGALKFENIIGTGANQIPPDSVVISAELSLYITNEGSAGATLHNLLIPFSEDMDYLTFTENSPDLFPTADADYEGEAVNELPGLSAGDMVDVDVASSLQSWINGELENNGWLFIPGGSNGVGVQASDRAKIRRPKLTIDSAAGVFEFQDGLNGYEGTADTFFLGQDPEAVNGNESEWEWDGEDGGQINYGALKFENIFGTGENQIPPDTEIYSAEITLQITNEGSGGATVHNLLISFNEEMDYLDFTENSPDIVPTADADYEAEAVSELPELSEGQVIDVDVTSSLQRIASGELENNGWLFVPGGTNGVGVQSSEHTPILLPTLIIDSAAGVFEFRDGLNGYEGTVDTFVNNGNNLEEVMGQEAEFEWDGEDAGGTNWGLLRFDNIIGSGENQIPEGTEINSAILKLQIVDPGSTGTLHELLEGSEDAPTDFNEEDTSMLFFADGFGPVAGVDYNDEVLAEVPGSTGILELDVTSSITKYANGEENRGWIFVPGGSNGAVATASDAVIFPPRLTVTIEGDTMVEDYSIY